MTKGTSETLTVTGTPAEALEGQTITWKSSNKDVVTVDSKVKLRLSELETQQLQRQQQARATV